LYQRLDRLFSQKNIILLSSFKKWLAEIGLYNSSSMKNWSCRNDKLLVELFSRVRFHLHFTSSFYARRSQKCKKTLANWLTVFLHFWNLRMFKLFINKLVKLTPVCHFSWSKIRARITFPLKEESDKVDLFFFGLSFQLRL